MYYFITGGVSFIVSNFVKYFKKTSLHIQITVLDTLTYAGNIKTLDDELPSITFIKGSIGDKHLVSSILRDNIIINFATKSHVDRSIGNSQIFLKTNILGIQNLLSCAKDDWQIGKEDKGYPLYKDNVKFIQVSTDKVYGSLSIDYPSGINTTLNYYNIQHIAKDHIQIRSYGDRFFTESRPLQAYFPYFAFKSSVDLIIQKNGYTYKLPYNIIRCSNNYAPCYFPEKLISLVIKNIIEGKDITHIIDL